MTPPSARALDRSLDGQLDRPKNRPPSPKPSARGVRPGQSPCSSPQSRCQSRSRPENPPAIDPVQGPTASSARSRREPVICLPARPEGRTSPVRVPALPAARPEHLIFRLPGLAAAGVEQSVSSSSWSPGLAGGGTGSRWSARSEARTNDLEAGPHPAHDDRRGGRGTATARSHRSASSADGGAGQGIHAVVRVCDPGLIAPAARTLGWDRGGCWPRREPLPPVGLSGSVD